MKRSIHKPLLEVACTEELVWNSVCIYMCVCVYLQVQVAYGCHQLSGQVENICEAIAQEKNFHSQSPVWRLQCSHSQSLSQGTATDWLTRTKHYAAAKQSTGTDGPSHELYCPMMDLENVMCGGCVPVQLGAGDL